MFSKNKGLAKTNSKELLLNKSGVNRGGKGTERYRKGRKHGGQGKIDGNPSNDTDAEESVCRRIE